MLLLSFQRLKLEFKLYWLLTCSIDLILVLKGRWHFFCPRGLEDVLSPPRQAESVPSICNAPAVSGELMHSNICYFFL